MTIIFKKIWALNAILIEHSFLHVICNFIKSSSLEGIVFSFYVFRVMSLLSFGYLPTSVLPLLSSHFSFVPSFFIAFFLPSFLPQGHKDILLCVESKRFYCFTFHIRSIAPLEMIFGYHEVSSSFIYLFSI